MQIKRFQAATMAEALSLVKKELGPEAVILSACSRKHVKGLLGSFKKGGVEVTAAGNGPFPPLEPNRSQADSEKIMINRRPHPVASNRPARPRMTERISYSPPRPSVRTPANRMLPKQPEAHRIMDESAHGNHDWLQRRLSEQGVEEAYVREMIADLRLTEYGVDPSSGSVSDQLAGIFEKIGVAAKPPVCEGDKQRCIAVVGATGVGKTTAISKLAAAYTLDANLRVALVSLDNIRVAASDQLQVFADIIDVPLEVVADKAGLENALVKFRHYDLILIDTPGLSIGNLEAAAVLAESLNAVGSLEVHLLFSATGRLRDNLNFFEHLEEISVSRLMFSKIDETAYYGDILNAMLRTQLPVSFFFDGAAGPDGVKKADLKLLADLLIEKVIDQNSLYAPGTNLDNRRRTRTVPMRWMPLPDETNLPSDPEGTAMGDRVETDQDRSRSGFFRFNGRRKRYTTA